MHLIKKDTVEFEAPPIQIPMTYVETEHVHIFA